MAAQLPPKAGFLVASAVVAHTLWTSAAPAMVYPLYAEEWGLSPAVTTAIFAVYPVTVVAVLIGFGDLAERAGRRAVMSWGVAASAAGTLLFVLAGDVATLMAGRVLMGIGVGLAAGPSAAALVAAAGGARQGSAATIIAQAAGLAAALLMGGALVQYAPYPTRLSFVVLFSLLVLLLAALSRLPPERQAASARPWRPSLPQVPADLRRPFLFAALTVMTAYSHGVLIASLGAQVAHDLVHSANALVNGAVLALFAVTLGLTGVLARRLPAHAAVLSGSLASIAGMGSLAASVLDHSLAWFLAATVASGVGYALMTYGGLAAVGAAAPGRRQDGLISGVLMLAYLFSGLLALGLGEIATLADMTSAVLIGGSIMTLLCALVALLAGTGRRASCDHYEPIGS
ncbi:MFS transporter [Geminicoccus roseus]|uniref:MFS transporter n=1 Tax=Geminicoccus roseus TaxID=404900 RepID=UPI000401FC0A|nr:MFS transporter [Geminicoccus roseus]